MTLLDAKEYDPRRDRRRRLQISTTIFVVLVIAFFAWNFRYWPEERIVAQFFDALQNKQYETAYGIWFHDPDWQQHKEKYAQYPYNEFYQDWGPGGEWGLIKSHRIYASGTPKGGSASGVIVEVIVNDRSEHARVWVQKSDKTLTFSPY
jgi:hypothetical protein